VRRCSRIVNALSAIEREASNLSGTLARIEAALVAEGIIFLEDGRQATAALGAPAS
jgi:hypothetical protein